MIEWPEKSVSMDFTRLSNLFSTSRPFQNLHSNRVKPNGQTDNSTFGFHNLFKLAF